MAPGLPARRWVIVCALVAGAPASADKREVAVIDLSVDNSGRELTNRIYDELTKHADLRPLAKRVLDSALAGPLLDEDAHSIDLASAAKSGAEDALANFDYADARKKAENGEEDLARAAPTAQAIALYADLALAHGFASFHLHDANNANRAFELVHRLDPIRRLDENRVIPELVSAYVIATTTTPQKARLMIKGTGRVWIDGIERGSAPGEFEVGYGDHVVHLTGAERETRGKLVHVPDVTDVAIEDAPADEELRVKRARLALALAPDSAARAGAMKQLAALLGVGDAVLILKSEDGKLLVQTWRDRAPGFSARREHTDEPPLDLLSPLAPPRPPEPPKPPVIPFNPPKHEPEPLWYDKTWVRASVAGGVIATVVGTILWIKRDHMVDFNRDIKQGM